MNAIDAVVIAAGVGLIAFELWFFLGRRKQPSDRQPVGKINVQEFAILVKNGYTPDTVTVEVGRPVRLRFYRDETAGCSSQVIFEGLGVERDLPAFETTTIEFTPNAPGDYPFHCGLDLFKGRVAAQSGGETARANIGRGHAKHG